MKEICPACDSLILLENVENAVCGNGHSWSTLFCLISVKILNLVYLNPSISYFRSMFDHLVYSVDEYDSQVCGLQQEGDSPTVKQIVGPG